LNRSASPVSSLIDLVDAAWADALGCPISQLHAPGAHLVPGGACLAGYRGIYMARLDHSVLVYTPPTHFAAARQAISTTAPEELFTATSCLRIAGPDGQEVLGPSWHGFVDGARFRAAEGAFGEKLDPADHGLDELRRACGENEWAEAGFSHIVDGSCVDAVVYGGREGGRLVAAGNMTDFRGMPADVGVVTHPAFRRRGLARRLVSRMTTDQLPDVGVVRYRALHTNLASLGVAGSLGFIGRGENLAVRLEPA